jgi:Carboxypeptidase regulatory-like domain
MQSRFRANALAILAVVAALLFLASSPPILASSPELISVMVAVTDAETGKPISQAHITLQFREPRGKLKRSKMLSYSAKTNAEGRYKFVDIPEGTVLLIVTDEHHQTFGKQFDVSKENPLLEVKLKPPQPML